MRRLLLIGLCWCCLLIAHAQEAPTLAELIASNPDLSILREAASRLDTTLSRALLSKSEAWTLFAPTDEAFHQLATEWGIGITELLADPVFVSEMISYHLVASVYTQADLGAETELFLPTALANDDLHITHTGETVWVDTARIMTADIPAANGILHLVDAVLVPDGIVGEELDETTLPLQMLLSEMRANNTPNTDLPLLHDFILQAATAPANPDFSLALLAISQASPIILETLSHPDETLTFFIPTDAAMLQTVFSLNIQAGTFFTQTEVLTQILLYNTLQGRYTQADLTEAQTVTTLSGDPIHITQADNTALLNDTGRIVIPDIPVANGIVQVVDTLLLPPDLNLRDENEVTLADVVALYGVDPVNSVAVMGEAFHASPLWQELQDTGNFITVFMPVDKALEAVRINPTGDNLAVYVIDGAWLTDDLAEIGELETMGGTLWQFTATDDGLLINGQAYVIVGNLEAINGVLHLLDKLP